MAAHQKGNRYPRFGERIAPATLSQVLLEPIPSRLLSESAGPMKLCNLDETVWERLAPGAIEELAGMVLARVAAGCARHVFDRRRIPRPPRGIRLSDLRLEHRTHVCLAREGFAEDLEPLGQRTIGEVLGIRAFGPRCLVDLLSALETRLARSGRLSPELTREAEQLAALGEAALVWSDDPRFDRLIREVDAEAGSAKELADRLLARRCDPPDAAHAADQVRRLRQRIVAMRASTLEAEMIEIFASGRHERNREIVIGYYGWGDGRSHTLAEIGARYGMTRERTRQICAKWVRRSHPERILAPVLDRTLAFIQQRLPRSVPALEKELTEARLTAVGLGLVQIERAATLLARPVPFAVVRLPRGSLAVRPEQVALPAAATEWAKKEVYYHGLTTVERVADWLARKVGAPCDHALVREAVQWMDGFCWLDESAGWFRLRTIARHGLPKAIEKVLAVAPRIRLVELHSAVSRNRRLGNGPVPEPVLREFCRQMDGVRIEGDRAVAEAPRDWHEVLTGVEAELVAILQEHGPLMARGALEDLCVQSGMKRFSFHAFLACSPVIAQYGHSVYGLVGADVQPHAVDAMIAKQRAERVPTRVLDCHGQTDDGKVWLSYRLSKAASTYAVVTVPAALKEAVSGKFQLRTPEGRRVGTLAAKDGRAWGLGAYLRQNRAQTDDGVLMTLDLVRREAVISLQKEPVGVK